MELEVTNNKEDANAVQNTVKQLTLKRNGHHSKCILHDVLSHPNIKTNFFCYTMLCVCIILYFYLKCLPAISVISC